jgi:sulfide:quinone oxidoreductase
MKSQTVVVLGGGIGGVVAANRLRKRLERRHRVVLVNREDDFSFAASYLWVMNGSRRPEQVVRPLKKLERRGIEVVIGNVDSIDPVERRVMVEGRALQADHLVVSLGADWDVDRVPGMFEYGHTFSTLNGARELGAKLKNIETGRIVVVTAAPLYKCPAAPYEAALLIEAGLRKRGVRDRVSVAMRSAEAAPMPVAGKEVSKAVMDLMAVRGIDYQPATQIASVEPGRVHFGGTSEAADLLVYMPTIKSPSVVANSSLAASDGWIHSDRATLATEFENVFAIGDNTQIPLVIGKPLPRAGVFAHGQAKVVAERISASINGKLISALYEGEGGCFIEIGDGVAAYGSGNFYAEPTPEIKLRTPARRWHWGKSALELLVMQRWL